MADLNLNCPSCGKTFTMSEFALGAGLKCVYCGQPVSAPPRGAATGGLRVRASAGGSDPVPLTAAAAERENLDRAAAASAAPDETMARVYKAREKPRGSGALIGWVIFLGVFLALVSLQRAIQDGAAVLDAYNWFRGLLGAVVFLLVLVMAFEDAVGHGVAALLFPPYAIYYALVRIETYWVRSLFLALFLALFSELYFIREEAAILKAQQAFNRLIEGGEQMIQRAGEAPTFERNRK
jgi:hypothetical protein